MLHFAFIKPPWIKAEADLVHWSCTPGDPRAHEDNTLCLNTQCRALARPPPSAIAFRVAQSVSGALLSPKVLCFLLSLSPASSRVLYIGGTWATVAGLDAARRRPTRWTTTPSHPVTLPSGPRYSTSTGTCSCTSFSKPGKVHNKVTRLTTWHKLQHGRGGRGSHHPTSSCAL